MIRKISQLSFLLVASIVSLGFAKAISTEPTATLTVVVNGIQNQKGEVCIGLYSQKKGFPLNTKNVLKSACTQIVGRSIKQQFSGLKHGKYAVAIVDDQNGDRQLNRDFFGIPQEGFGISNNPKVSIKTGAPKFQDASFILNSNKTINISMKYRLDP
ncbi:MAG: DUF2141 domain-containing protein [Calothrix sp. MO_192.B10]|nr:DUF2141 domain-containing protein [Calothrix sp. MO_192.B10]